MVCPFRQEEKGRSLLSVSVAFILDRKRSCFGKVRHTSADWGQWLCQFEEEGAVWSLHFSPGHSEGDQLSPNTVGLNAACVGSCF